jgi:hypothetical protein
VRTESRTGLFRTHAVDLGRLQIPSLHNINDTLSLAERERPK